LDYTIQETVPSVNNSIGEKVLPIVLEQLCLEIFNEWPLMRPRVSRTNWTAICTVWALHSLLDFALLREFEASDSPHAVLAM